MENRKTIYKNDSNRFSCTNAKKTKQKKNKKTKTNIAKQSELTHFIHNEQTKTHADQNKILVITNSKI